MFTSIYIAELMWNNKALSNKKMSLRALLFLFLGEMGVRIRDDDSENAIIKGFDAVWVRYI